MNKIADRRKMVMAKHKLTESQLEMLKIAKAVNHILDLKSEIEAFLERFKAKYKSEQIIPLRSFEKRISKPGSAKIALIFDIAEIEQAESLLAKIREGA